MTRERVMGPKFDPAKKPWGVFDSYGRCLFLDLCKDELDCWTIALGWPSKEEVEDAKRRGMRARRVSIAVEVGTVD